MRATEPVVAYGQPTSLLSDLCNFALQNYRKTAHPCAKRWLLSLPIGRKSKHE